MTGHCSAKFSTSCEGTTRAVQFQSATLSLVTNKAPQTLQYLEEHGLCKSGVMIGADGHLALGESRITAAGLDFLEDDGGLSAILGVVTVRLHADTIRALIDAKIEVHRYRPKRSLSFGRFSRIFPKPA